MDEISIKSIKMYISKYKKSSYQSTKSYQKKSCHKKNIRANIDHEKSSLDKISIKSIKMYISK
jgi:hypothetical protein